MSTYTHAQALKDIQFFEFLQEKGMIIPSLSRVRIIVGIPPISLILWLLRCLNFFQTFFCVCFSSCVCGFLIIARVLFVVRGSMLLLFFLHLFAFVFLFAFVLMWLWVYSACVETDSTVVQIVLKCGVCLTCWDKGFT